MRKLADDLRPIEVDNTSTSLPACCCCRAGRGERVAGTRFRTDDLPGFKFFAPFTTMLVLSIVISLIVWLMRR